MKRVHIILSGDIQGIGFRYFISSKAKSLGINGWVKNLEYDKVEAIFEGNDDNVKEILDSCVRGHSLAKIKNIKINKEDFKDEKEFKIRWKLL